MKKIDGIMIVILMLVILVSSSCSSSGASNAKEPQEEEYAIIWVTSDLGEGQCLPEGGTFSITISIEPSSQEIGRHQQAQLIYKVAGPREDGVLVLDISQGKESQLLTGSTLTEKVTLSFEDGSTEQAREIALFKYIGKQGMEFCFAQPDEAKKPLQDF